MNEIIKQDFSRNVWCLLGLPFDAVDMSQTVEIILETAVNQRRCFLSTPNLNFLCAAQADVQFKHSVINSELSIADGFPLILIAKLLNIPLPERVAGSDLIAVLDAKTTDKALKVFFFGGEEGMGAKACKIINQASSGLEAVGHYVPGFGSVDAMSTPEIIEFINQHEIDFLIVALGAKKGQAWIEQNRQQLNAPIISHLGAVINFFAGSVIRAPLTFQKWGLEWLWRIYQEPHLWQRYYSDGLQFLGLLATRVLPYWLWMQTTKVTGLFNSAVLRKLIYTQIETDSIEISLSGIACVDTIQPLRDIFLQAAISEKNIELNLDKTSLIDGAFIGLVLILYKHVIASGCNLVLTHASTKILRILKWHQSEFLLANIK